MRSELPRWVVPLAFASLAVAWLSSVSSFVQGGDNAEFATLFARWGVAHPPGYPIYGLYLRAMGFVPAISPAHGAAIVTTFIGLAGVVVLYRAARAWGASTWSALLAITLFATASLPWRLSTLAEVFALHMLVAASVLLFAAPDSRRSPAVRCALLGAAAGVGLANHLSIVLLAPLGLYALAHAARASGRPLRSAALAVAAAVPGLASYGLVIVAARLPGDRLRWGATETFRGLVHHVLRADYGTTNLAANGRPALPGAQLAFLAESLWRDSRGIGVVLAVVGFAAMLAPRARRGHGLALLATLALAGPLFAARFNIPLAGLGTAVVSRFHLLPLVLLVVPVALGFDRVVQNAELDPRLRVLVLAAVVATGVALTWPAVRAEHGPEIEQYLLDTMEVLPPRSVVLGTGDELTFGAEYVRIALGLHADVVVLNPSLLPLAPYRARLEERLGFALPAPRGGSVDTVALARAVLAEGRPLFLAEVFTPRIVQTFATWPQGTLIRVLPPGVPPPSLQDVVADADGRFARFRMRPVSTVVGPWQSAVRERYARTWLTLSIAARARGAAPLADACARRGLTYAPWLEDEVTVGARRATGPGAGAGPGR